MQIDSGGQGTKREGTIQSFQEIVEFLVSMKLTKATLPRTFMVGNMAVGHYSHLASLPRASDSKWATLAALWAPTADISSPWKAFHRMEWLKSKCKSLSMETWAGLGSLRVSLGVYLTLINSKGKAASSRMAQFSVSAAHFSILGQHWLIKRHILG
jgi:hypothetical protein